MKGLRDKKITLAMTLVLCSIAATTGSLCSYAALAWPTRTVQVKLNEIDRLAEKRFIGEIDRQQLADYAAAGYVQGLGDKWSSYITADEYESYTLTNEGKSCGIGVSVITSEDSVRINQVYAGSPAEKAGLQRGDYILGAEDTTVEKDGGYHVVDAVRGKEGEEVHISVQKNQTDDIQELTMVREVVAQTMAWSEILDEPDKKIGYLRIENFHAGSAEQFHTALEQLTGKSMQGLVIDVRHNGGGRVREMSMMLDELLPEGIIMTLTTKNGHETVYSSDADMIQIPVSVLIDEQSISAAEFFTAALQEYDRAELVGAHTTGKGRAQQTFQLSDGSAVNLSVEQYFTPKGNSLADVGVEPDTTIELSEEQKKDFWFMERENDPQLQTAVKSLMDRQE